MLVPHTYNYFIIYIIVRMWYKHYSLVHLPHYLVLRQIRQILPRFYKVFLEIIFS